MDKVFRLKKEARQFFRASLQKDRAVKDFWTKEGIPHELLEPCELVYVDEWHATSESNNNSPRPDRG